MRPRFNKEEDLARLIVEYLRDLRWEVYQEVQPPRTRGCADIVAVQGPVVWVIETKLSFGLSVIEQAYDWRGLAHYVSVAVPYRRRGGRMAEVICRRLGIGLLQVGVPPYKEGVRIVEKAPPDFFRKASARIRECLTDRHKDYAAAGNADGRRFTPFKRTCEDLARAVRERPGLTLREILDSVKTHYLNRASARTCLPRWIRQGIVAGVRLTRKGGRLRLYPAKSPSARSIVS